MRLSNRVFDFFIGIFFVALIAWPVSLLAKENFSAETELLDFSPDLVFQKREENPWRLEKQNTSLPAFMPKSVIEVSREEAPFYLEIDEYRGSPHVNFPVKVAPGANGLQPDLKIRIGNDELGSELTHPPSIRRCGMTGEFCIEGQKLVAASAGVEAGRYQLQSNPRLDIRKSEAGFRIENEKGLVQYYTAADQQNLDTGPWEINGISDWFENFILYSYDDDNGQIKAIHYGQDRAAKKHLRSVHLTYDDKSTPSVSSITTKISGQIIRQYFLKRNAEGRIESITECAPDREQETQCFVPHKYQWKEGSAGVSSLLVGILNGNGGQSRITYDDRLGDPVVSSLTLQVAGQQMQKQDYRFFGPILVAGKRVGFDQSRSVQTGRNIGQFTLYGRGKYAGTVLKQGSFTPDQDQGIDNENLDINSETSYHFTDINDRTDSPFLLTEIENRTFVSDGTVTLVDRETRRYDEENRIKVVHTEAGEDHFIYLDDVKPEFVRETAGNLLVERRHIPVAGDPEVSKKWDYKLKDGVVVGSIITASHEAQPIEALGSTQRLDTHGNIAQISKQGKVTSFQYDLRYGTYPVSMEILDGEQQTTVSWEYDAATGQMTEEHYPDGSITKTTLDAMGRVSVTRAHFKDPETTDRFDVSDRVTLEKAEGGGTIKTSTAILNNPQTSDSLTKITKTHHDGAGRLLRIEGMKLDKEGLVTARSFLENTYSLGQQVMRVVDEAGLEQTTRFDANGQIISRSQEGYGEVAFDYDDLGRVREIEKAGERTHLHYDAQNRLIRKILPGNQEFQYQYDPAFSQKISDVRLPTGKHIFYTYSDQGQVAQKTVNLRDENGVDRSFVTDFKYKENQLQSVIYPDGSRLIYDYVGERLSSVYWDEEEGRKTVATYQPEIMGEGGAVLTKTLGNDIDEKYRWLKDGRLADLSFIRGGSASGAERGIAALAYSFSGKNGLLSQEKRRNHLRDGDQALVQSYEYDTSGHLNRYKASLNNKATDRVAYDRFNNRGRIEDVDPAAINVDGRQAEISRDHFENIKSVQFGADGREIRSQFLFDMENKLVTSLVSAGRAEVVTHYDYDHLGERIEKRTEGGSTTYYISPFYEFVVKADGSMQETRYVWDHMGRIAAFTNPITEEDFAGLIPTIQTGLTQLSDALPRSAAAILPMIAILAFTLLSLRLFDRYSGPRLRISGTARIRPGLAFLSSCMIAVFVTTLAIPTAQAALEAGDGTPKINQVTYFHHDIRGSVIAVSDEAGHQTASVAYHPYGTMMENKVTAGNNNFRFKFTGMEYDSETGLYYDHARYYDPKIGKFLSPDPAQQFVDPNAYTNRDPVNFKDPDGRMQTGIEMGHAPDNVPPELRISISSNEARARDIELGSQGSGNISMESGRRDSERSATDQENWVRFPTFWNWTFGTHAPNATAPSTPSVGDQGNIQNPMDGDEEDYSRLARSGYMQGWTRLGGYIQSLLGAGLLAWWFPSSHTFDDGSIATPGFFKDLGLYAMTVTAFSAYGKGYTANEAMYWQGVTEQGATSKDYTTLALRRMFWKVSVQLVAFTSISLFAKWVRGFPVFEEESDSQEALTEFGYLLLKNFVFSAVGTAALLPYYLMTKAPTATYDSEMTKDMLDAMPWWQRWTLKASIAYRSFNGRQGFWAQEQPAYSKGAVLQAMWYPLYILQMYGWYLVGSAGYYGGYASVVPVIPQIGWEAFRGAWRRNLTLIILAPAASPLAYVNAWHRKSFTLLKKRSRANPRTEGLWFRILGPIEGLRMAKFNDTSYLHQDEWVHLLQHHRDGSDGGDASAIDPVIRGEGEGPD